MFDLIKELFKNRWEEGSKIATDYQVADASTSVYKQISDSFFPEGGEYTRIEPVNKTHSLEEGIQARVKDPLWLLGKQWQMGEFRAQNGGTPVRTEFSFCQRVMDRIKLGKDDTVNFSSFDLKTPLEMKAEEEIHSNNDIAVKAWDPVHLEYSFRIKGSNNDNPADPELVAEEYDGNRLDWYSFNLASDPDDKLLTEEDEVDVAIPPSNIIYHGMPSSRWWTFEDKRIDVGDIRRPYLNYLTMLLVEFALLYSNDWFYLPLEHNVGNIRKITRFKVIDSFGAITEVEPVTDISSERKGWEIFTLSPPNGGDADPSLFYMPNNLFESGLESEPIEEVSLLRDELANLVWAIESKYEDDNGEVINRHDDPQPAMYETIETPIHYWDNQDNVLIEKPDSWEEGEPGNRYTGPLAKYELMSYLPAHWIPYIARKIQYNGKPIDGQIVLRRARTMINTSETQYKGVLLKESTHIAEEEVPRAGIKLTRAWQLARKMDGSICLWSSRKKRPDMRRKSSGLHFDYLIERGLRG